MLPLTFFLFLSQLSKILSVGLVDRAWIGWTTTTLEKDLNLLVGKKQYFGAEKLDVWIKLFEYAHILFMLV